VKPDYKYQINVATNENVAVLLCYQGLCIECVYVVNIISYVNLYPTKRFLREALIEDKVHRPNHDRR